MVKQELLKSKGITALLQQDYQNQAVAVYLLENEEDF